MPESDLPMPLVAAAPTADLVARHAAFVRALARRLCRTEADADDLAQDTWVEALRRPAGAWGAPDDRPDGWLARVAHRLAGRRARGERRRADREALAAQDTLVARAHTPGARPLDASLEHALVLRDVADALVALDEDARRIVVARHFEGLELAALAAREGVATSTLKLRLGAAYERLRARLDGGAGGDRARWTHALIAATGGAPLAQLAPTSTAPTSTGTTPKSAVTPRSPASPRVAPLGATAGALRVLLAPTAAHLSPVSLLAMGLTLKLSAVVAVGALVASGLALRRDERGSQALAPLQANTSLAGSDHAALATAAAQTERTATPGGAAAETERAPVDPRELSAVATVDVLVTDLDGAPAPGVEVLAAPWDGPLNRVGTTDERGACTLRWRPGFGGSRVLVALRARGVFLGGLRALEAPAGGRAALRVALDPSLLPAATSGVFESRLRLLTSAAHGLDQRIVGIEQRLDSLQGREVELVFDSSELMLSAEPLAETIVDARPVRRRGPLEVDAEQLGEGEVAFACGSGAALEVAEQAYVSLSRTLVDNSMGVTFDFVLGIEEPAALIRGVVRDVAGLPAASARVTARPLDVEDGSPVVAITDGDGRFELRAPFGRTAVVAGTGPNPGSRAEVVLLEGDERTCDLTLDRGLALLGVARSGEAPLAGAHVEATATRGDERWLAIAVTDAEGRFVIPHCAAPAVDLDVFAPDSGVPVPLATFEGVWAGLEPFAATLDPAALERLVVVLHDDELGAVPVGELRVHDDRRARVARVPVLGEVGTPVDLQLPPGCWWLSAAASGPHHGAPQRIELHRAPPDAPEAPPAQQTLDVGPTAALALPEPPEGAAWRVDRLLPGRAPSAVALSIAGAPVRDLEVPPGSYTVRAIGADAAVLTSTELELKTGERAAPRTP